MLAGVPFQPREREDLGRREKADRARDRHSDAPAVEGHLGAGPHSERGTLLRAHQVAMRHQAHSRRRALRRPA